MYTIIVFGAEDCELSNRVQDGINSAHRAIHG